jgi:hypothetical protein
MKKIIFLVMAVAALTSCSKSDQDEVAAKSDIVKLGGAIDDAVTTRGDGVIAQRTALKLDLFRADMTENLAFTGTYDKTFTGTLAAGAEPSNPGTIAPSPAQAFFRDENRKSKFVAVYPQGGTVDLAKGTVAYTLDGAMDVMGSDLVQGSIATGEETVKLLIKHLLTQIEVVIQNGGSDATEIASIVSSWGKIESIKVDGQIADVLLTLPDPSGQKVAPTIAANSADPVALSLWQKNGDAAPALAMPADGTTTPTFGNAMFLAPGDGNTITLLVKTDIQGSAAQPITVKGITNYAAGNKYKITLKFMNDFVDANAEFVGAIAAEWADAPAVVEEVD